MKFAVISEVCGNLVALQAFLGDVAKRKVDFILCLGNFLGFGPSPIECLNIVTGKQFRTTKGSLEFLASESAIAGPVSLNDEEWHMLMWLRNRLSENEQKKLRQLPMKLKIHLTDKGDQSLLMCHTSLQEDNTTDSADNTMRIHTELAVGKRISTRRRERTLLRQQLLSDFHEFARTTRGTQLRSVRPKISSFHGALLSDQPRQYRSAAG